MGPQGIDSVAIIYMTMGFLFLGGFIIFFVTIYRFRRNKHIREKLVMESEFRQTILQSQLEIQEQTFNNISQEIHDNVGQILSLAKVQINIMNESEIMNREMLNEVKENVSKAMTDLRDIAKSLSSERVRTLSIHAVVMAEAERVNKSGISNVIVTAEGAELKINEQKKLILFRIIQESLQNSIKHANASLITIGLRYLPAEIAVTIHDNGKGFDTEKAMQQNSGLGLLNIKTRASLTGGSSSIESSPDSGTTVKITIPYE